jgi:hypothetical protein
VASRRLAAIARVVLIAGAAGSIALMLRAGARQRSALLIFLFTGWVLSPFMALLLADLRASRWRPRVRGALYGAMIGVSVVSLDVYGFHAVRGAMKAGFVYLFGPAMCWLLIAVVLGAAAIVSRKAVRAGTLE